MSLTGPGGWALERASGSAAGFHARELPDPARRAVWVFDVTAAAIVLGSTQRPAVLRPGVDLEVVRRRSGGGSVLLVPGDVLWIDVVLPRGDVLWHDDVGRAAHWLGETWVEALAALGVTGADVHRQGLACGPWCSLVCFAGIGPGEVTLGGAKVVGISQRRTRAGARFQCAVHRRWDPVAAVAPLADPRPAPDELAGLVAEVTAPLADLEAAFLAALPD